MRDSGTAPRSWAPLGVFSVAFAAAAVFAIAWVLVFGNPSISVDGWQYLSSAKAIVDGSMLQNYFWVRAPGYPAFVTLAMGPGGFWSVIVVQTLLYAAGWAFLVTEAWVVFRARIRSGVFWAIQVVAGLLLWFYIGGYVTWVLQQSLMIPMTAALAAFTVHECRLAQGRVDGSAPTSRAREVLRIAIWVLFAIGAYLITSLFVIAVLAGWLVVFIATRRAGGRLKTGGATIVIALVALIVAAGLVHVAWSQSTKTAAASPDFNPENFEDPFWSASYVNGIADRVLTRETYYGQEIAVSATSLLDITQSRGWRGLVNNEYRTDERNINYVFGTEPWTAAGQTCLDNGTDRTGILTVTPGFMSEFRGSNVCPLTDLSTPKFLGFLGWFGWMVLLVAAALTLIRRPSTINFAFAAPGLAIVAVYAVGGGAIARYGAPAYLPLAVLGASAIAVLFSRRKRA